MILVLYTDYLPEFYNKVNEYWRRESQSSLQHINVVSIGGGSRDILVNYHLTRLDGIVSPDRAISVNVRNNFFSVLLILLLLPIILLIIILLLCSSAPYHFPPPCPLPSLSSLSFPALLRLSYSATSFLHFSNTPHRFSILSSSHTMYNVHGLVLISNNQLYIYLAMLSARRLIYS